MGAREIRKALRAVVENQPLLFSTGPFVTVARRQAQQHGGQGTSDEVEEIVAQYLSDLVERGELKPGGKLLGLPDDQLVGAVRQGLIQAATVVSGQSWDETKRVREAVSMALATPVPLPAHLPTSIRANDQRLDIRAVREAVSWVLANDRSVSRDVRSLSAAILSRYAARPVPLDQELERTLAGRNWTAYLSRTVHSFGEAKRLQRLGLHREDLEAFKARMQGRTLAEIAEETGLSTSGVKKRAEKVVAALEEYVRQHRGATDYDHMKFALRRLLDEPPPH